MNWTEVVTPSWDVAVCLPTAVTSATTEAHSPRVRNTTGNHGDVFVECTFAAPDGKKADYGRTKSNHGTAYPDAEFVVINCKVKNIIPQGWSAIGEKSSRMYEFNTCDMETGKPVDVSQRHAYSRQLDAQKDAALIADYMNPAFCIERMATFQLFEIILHKKHQSEANI